LFFICFIYFIILTQNAILHIERDVVKMVFPISVSMVMVLTKLNSSNQIHLSGKNR